MENERTPEWQRILDAFRRNGGILTPLDITNGLKINQYNRAISDLRKKGHRVESEELGIVDGVRRTRFTLVERGAPSPHKPKSIYEIADEYRRSKQQPTLF